MESAQKKHICGCLYTYFSELLMVPKNADVAGRCSTTFVAAVLRLYQMAAVNHCCGLYDSSSAQAVGCLNNISRLTIHFLIMLHVIYDIQKIWNIIVSIYCRYWYWYFYHIYFFEYCTYIYININIYIYIYIYIYYIDINTKNQLEPHKAVRKVSKIGNL